MKSNQTHRYVTSLAVSFVVCLVGMLIAAVGLIGDWMTVVAVGGLLTLPLTALLLAPSLALVAFGPIAMVLAVGAGASSTTAAKLVTVVLVLVGLAWAGFFGHAIYGMTLGRWMSSAG